MSSPEQPESSNTIKRSTELDEVENASSTTKRLKLDDINLRDIPSCEAYERSYMHRDVISHVRMTMTQFLVTFSVDGFIKFWKKTPTGIDFVKTFKSHLGPIEDVSVTVSGSELATIGSTDKSVKIFDVANFDMINMIELDFNPGCIEWIHKDTFTNENLAISDKESNSIYIFYSHQPNSTPIRKLDQFNHLGPIVRMRYNAKYHSMISVDSRGYVKYWTCDEDGDIRLVSKPMIKFEPHPRKSYLRDFPCQRGAPKDKEDSSKKVPVKLHNMTISANGQYIVTTSSDRMIRVFNFLTGNLLRLFDESLTKLDQSQRDNPTMNNIDFARRRAIEQELERKDQLKYEEAILDQSSSLLIIPSMLGIKIFSLKSRELVRSLGSNETNFRPLSMTLFQGLIFEKIIRKASLESLQTGTSDPTLYATSYKKNRFYCFSNRYFEEESGDQIDETTNQGPIKDRDILNERPTREEALAAF